MKTLKNIKVGDKIFVLFDNTILAEPSEIKVLTVDKKGRKFIYSGHYKFNIEYGNNVSNITVRNLTAFATFEEAEEKAKKKAESDEYGFLDNADENAKKVIKGMFENVAGERKVVVEFK